MKLQQVTGTKDTVVKIGTAINTIKEFIKQGIIRPIRGLFYVESTAGSGLSYVSGSAPSLGDTALVPPAPITYSIAATVDETTSLKWHFDATPTGKAGTYDFGDGKTHVVANGESAHTYAAAGDYTVTFTPGDGNAAVTTDITVAAAAEPPAEPPAV